MPSCKCGDPWKNKLLYNNGTEQRFFNSPDEVPDGWIKGAIPGTINSNTRGRIAYNNGINHIYLKPDDIPPEGYTRGYSAERKLKNSTSNKRVSKDKHWYNNGVEQRYFSENDDIPEGWKPGCCKLRTY